MKRCQSSSWESKIKQSVITNQPASNFQYFYLHSVITVLTTAGGWRRDRREIFSPVPCNRYWAMRIIHASGVWCSCGVVCTMSLLTIKSWVGYQHSTTNTNQLERQIEDLVVYQHWDLQVFLQTFSSRITASIDHFLSIRLRWPCT